MSNVLGILWILVGLFLILYFILLIKNTIKTKIKNWRRKDDKNDKEKKSFYS